MAFRVTLRCLRSLPSSVLAPQQRQIAKMATGGRDFSVRFDSKTALVTGAGKGIGRDVALQLAALGARVVAVSRTQTDLDQLVSEDSRIHGVLLDVSDVEATKRAITAIGNVDLLVNNAGIAKNAPFLDATAEDFDATMAVNVRAIVVVSQIVAKNMIARKVPGAIVNVSSQASMIGLRDHTAYCASKGAVDNLTRVMALELGPHGIRCNAVNPTVVLTALGAKEWGNPAKGGPMLAKIPLGRFAEVHEVVEPIMFLLSDKASMINGVMLPIDGGFLAT